MSDWVRHKFDWLASVLAHGSTRGLPHDIASLLAIRYFHSERQQAWPSIDTLARDLNVDQRSIQRALDKLVDAKLLVRVRGGGRRNSNRYTLPEKISLPRRRRKGGTHATHSSEKGGVQSPKGWRAGPERVASRAQKGGVDATQVEKNREDKGGRESARLRRDSPSGRDLRDCLAEVKQAFTAGKHKSPRPKGEAPQRKQHNSSDKKPTAFPTDWHFSNEELAAAQNIAGWDLEKVEEEFSKFRRWHQHKASRSGNWAAAWETWCQRGADYAESKQPLTGLASFMAGLRDDD